MNRSNFYNEKDFLIDMKLYKEYLGTDMGIFVYLFSLNIVNSKKDIYGESMPNEKEFLEPVKLNVYVNTTESKTSKLGNGIFTDESLSDVTFGLYIDELTEKGLDPKRGDFILYDDNNTKRFFEIETISNITTNNNMNNFKNFYKLVKSNYVKDYLLPDNLKNLI